MTSNTVWQEPFAGNPPLTALGTFDTRVSLRPVDLCQSGDATIPCGACTQGFDFGTDGTMACRAEPICKDTKDCTLCQVSRQAIQTTGSCEACVEAICDSITERCMCAGHS